MQYSPLVSFILVAYQQERFVRDAVRSALAQTYHPMEIILSDDSSKDRTFAIMCDEVSSYTGPHCVVLNQSKRNLGLARHVSSLFEQARGEVFVMQGGDDISIPTRTSVLMHARSTQTNTPDLVCSYVREIREDGEPTGRIWKDVTRNTNLRDAIENGSCVALGTTAAYSRMLFDKYGALNDRIRMEDWVLAFRALLEGGIHLVKEPLVDYRIHGDSLSSQLNFRAAPVRGDVRRRQRAEAELAVAEEWLRDWDRCGRKDSKIRAKIVRNVSWKAFDVAACDATRVSLVVLALKAICRGISPRRAVGLIRRHAF